MTAPATPWRDWVRVHPAADMFPMMSDDELDELGRDIREHGLQQPVVLWTPERLPGRKGPKEIYLLDGRNRLAAIERAFAGDIERQQDEIEGALYIGIGGARLFRGDDDPWAFVVSANLHRRHLTREQKHDLVEKLLKAKPERSDRETARLAKVSPTKVGAVRHDLERVGDVSKLDTRTDAVGRQQPAAKPPKPPNKEAQVRALREQRAGHDIESPVTAAPSAAPRVLDRFDVVQALRVLQGDPGRIAHFPLEKRVALAWAALNALNVTLGDLQSIGGRS